MLYQLLRDPSMAVRRLALRQLGRLGRMAEIIVPALVEALGDLSESVRLAACKALDAILADCLRRRGHNPGVPQRCICC
jgi:HEAT repeat protein